VSAHRNEGRDLVNAMSGITLPDKLTLGAGVVGLVASFMPWYTISGRTAYNYSRNGWGVNFGGWFPVLLLMAAAGLVALRLFGVKLPDQAVTAVPVGQVVAPPLAAVIILLRWLTYPGGVSGYVSAGAGVGLFAGLAASALGSVGGWLVFRASGKQLPVDRSQAR
jgi:hypothetical protein